MIIPVDEFTTPAPFLVSPFDTLDKVQLIMSENDIRHIPVVENNLPVGIISSRDISVIATLGRTHQVFAREVMHRMPFTVQSGTALEVVALEMSDRKIGSAIVVDNEGEVVGIFTSTDALNALVEIIRDDETVKAYG